MENQSCDIKEEVERTDRFLKKIEINKSIKEFINFFAQI